MYVFKKTGANTRILSIFAVKQAVCALFCDVLNFVLTFVRTGITVENDKKYGLISKDNSSCLSVILPVLTKVLTKSPKLFSTP